jgi:hypothetical protein
MMILIVEKVEINSSRYKKIELYFGLILRSYTSVYYIEKMALAIAYTRYIKYLAEKIIRGEKMYNGLFCRSRSVNPIVNKKITHCVKKPRVEKPRVEKQSKRRRAQREPVQNTTE